MRKTLVDTLLKVATKDTYFLTADVGYGVLEPLKEKLGDRFINVGIAEQSMVGIATGLALAGKRVYIFTMCAFYLRALEQIRNDICGHEVPVTLIGVGTQFDYEQLGYSHFATEDDKIIKQLAGIKVYTPKTKQDLEKLILKYNRSPRYIRISRFDECKDFKIKKLKKYPHEGGSINYFKDRYGN